MKKEFIPYEIALALKELGFDEPCIGFYNVRSLFVPDYKVTKLQIDNLRLEKCCLAPTFAQAFRWFREKYNIDSMIDKNTKDEYFGNKRYHKLSKEYETITKGFKTYEEAELECLVKLIEIVKNK